MVVQCPTCQSKFRIADDKVSDRGVRVRCTACKNVFQVRKPGAASTGPAPGPGSTVDLSPSDAAAVRAGARSDSPAARVAPRPAAPNGRTAPARPAAAALRGQNGAARRLDADDLFGMAELTGDAPLGDLSPPPPAPQPPPPAPPPSPRPASKAMPNFDDIDLDVEDAPPPPPLPSRPPPLAPAADELLLEERKPAAEPTPAAELAFGELSDAGAAPAAPAEDPVEGLRSKKEEPRARTQPLPPAPPQELPPGKELVSSALTGLVGAALAVAVIVVAALSGEASASWPGFGASEDVVATRVVSGLYDTASGKPVFFVRGRIENHGAKVRGPVRVTAELVSDGVPEARAEAIAGAEPTAEEVWSLRTPSDVEKLNRALQLVQAERKLQPGRDLPFFAVFAEPPPDLQRHRLHVKVESVDAWVPPTRRGR